MVPAIIISDELSIVNYKNTNDVEIVLLKIEVLLLDFAETKGFCR